MLTRWISLILKLKPFCETTTKHDDDNDGDDYDRKIIPIEAWTGPEGFRSWRFPEFLHNQHVKGQGCQPYAPAAVNLRRQPWYSFLLEDEMTPGS
jgi:hypothetical protein